MVSSPVLRPPFSPPHLSRTFAKPLSPIPVRLRCHRLRSFSRISAAATSAEKMRSSRPSVAANSLYEDLGIPLGASTAEIRAAYRRLARICHPDVAAAGGDEFIRIHAAYSTLSDPVNRADYDRKLGRRRIRRIKSFDAVVTSAASSISEFARRNWETDQCW